VAAAVAAGACGGKKGEPQAERRRGLDPEQPGLAFTRVPAAAILNGHFELRVRLNDERGTQRIDDDTTMVSVRAVGKGALGGTRARPADGGFVRFDDLMYDVWETITLVVSAPGYADVTTPPFLVRPALRFAQTPPARAAIDAPVGPFVVELVDGQGAVVPADAPISLGSTDPYAVVEGGRERRFSAGRVRFEAVTLESEGSQTLVWQAPDVAMLAHGIMAFAGAKTEALWLRSGRVSAAYREKLPAGEAAFTVAEGALPAGLTLDPAGEIAGTPASAGLARFRLTSTDAAGVKTTWLAVLPVAPTDDPPAPTLDDLDRPGPFGVASLDEPVRVQVRGVSEPMRVYYPTARGGPAPGPFPLVLFHHGAARLEQGITTLYDHYGPLLWHWASHGFVVASVDGTSLVYQNGAYLPVTIGNLALLSEGLRAGLAHLRERNSDPSFALAHRLDLDRVVLAGHSRGAGAALIAAQATPSVLGLLLIKPVDPFSVAGGEMAWNRPLPDKPILLTFAGNDADVIYPVGDFLYERRSGPISAHTILGSLHAWSCDQCPAERGGVAQVTREEDWAVTNAFAVAFLDYVTGEDMSGAGVLFGQAGLSTGLTPQGILRRADRYARGVLVDDFQDEAPTNALGLPSYGTGLYSSSEEPWLRQAAQATPQLGSGRRSLYLQPEVLAYSRARQLRWSQGEAVYGNQLGSLDARGLGAFVFRARSDGAPFPGSQLRVRLRDGEGGVVTVEGTIAVGRNGIGARFSDVIVPLERFEAQGLDLAHLTSVELVLEGQGALEIDDLRFE
jgi:hypothetical protein